MGFIDVARVVESESHGVQVFTWSRSLSFEGDFDSGPYLFHLELCNFVAVYLTFVQFILQLKFRLYTIVHLLLEEFKISLKSSLSTQSCHTISPRVGVPQKKNRIPHPWM